MLGFLNWRRMHPCSCSLFSCWISFHYLSTFSLSQLRCTLTEWIWKRQRLCAALVTSSRILFKTTWSSTRSWSHLLLRTCILMLLALVIIGMNSCILRVLLFLAWIHYWGYSLSIWEVCIWIASIYCLLIISIPLVLVMIVILWSLFGFVSFLAYIYLLNLNLISVIRFTRNFLFPLWCRLHASGMCGILEHGW